MAKRKISNRRSSKLKASKRKQVGASGQVTNSIEERNDFSTNESEPDSEEVLASDEDSSEEKEDVDEEIGKMVVLSTVNDISEVGKLHEKWQEHLSGPIMVIEASAVERMDTSVLQLLCALIKDADDKGIEAEWKDAPEELKHAVKLLGLNGPLKLH